MLANRTGRWSIGAALICVLLLAASWFLLISPRRADAADVRTQVTATDNQAGDLRIKLAQLKAEFADLPAQKAKLKAIKQQLPPTADIPAFVRSMQSIAAQSGVSLDSITPGAPALLGNTPGNTASGPGSLVGIPMTITISGEYFETVLFLKQVQTKLQRSYLINGLALTPNEDIATATAAPTVAPTATAIATASPGSTATATPTPVVTAAPAVTDDTSGTLINVTVNVSGSIFVLLDGTSTLDEVTAATKAASKTGTKTPATTATTAPVAGGNESTTR